MENNTNIYMDLLHRCKRFFVGYDSSCYHRHLGPGFFFSIISIKCASMLTYMNPFDMLRCEINAFMNYAPFS